jgi:class 3 adenylate cyclase
MKRSLITTLCLGGLAAAIVLGLQRAGLLGRPEALFGRWISNAPSPNDRLPLGHDLLVVGLGFAVAWTMLQVTELTRRGELLLLLLVELIGASWVLGLGEIKFQPVPGILVALLAASLVLLFDFTQTGRRRRAATALFGGRLAQSGIARLTESGGRDLSAPADHEVTFVYCEVSNQADLVDEMKPADHAALTSKLIAHARELFLREGGYLHAADGEGLRVLFGFPNPLGNHAAAAARAALAFRDRVAAAALREPESLGKVQLRFGISSGVVVASLPEGARRDAVVLSGEPVELARRLAIANQIYGSQILLGPRAFSSAGAEIVARPLDFLRSIEAHDRLEVYELLALAAEASPEDIACRDCFWTGLVYFRERRWSEAFAEFNRARRANAQNDLPLQWYLHRLEPLILHMTIEPAPVADPFSPF